MFTFLFLLWVIFLLISFFVRSKHLSRLSAGSFPELEPKKFNEWFSLLKKGNNSKMVGVAGFLLSLPGIAREQLFLLLLGALLLFLYFGLSSYYSLQSYKIAKSAGIDPKSLRKRMKGRR